MDKRRKGQSRYLDPNTCFGIMNDDDYMAMGSGVDPNSSTLRLPEEDLQTALSSISPSSAQPRDEVWEDLEIATNYAENGSVTDHNFVQPSIHMVSPFVPRLSRNRAFLLSEGVGDFDFYSSSSGTTRTDNTVLTPSQQSVSSISQFDMSLSSQDPVYCTPRIDRPCGPEFLGFQLSPHSYLKPPETVCGSSYAPSEACSDNIDYGTTRNITHMRSYSQEDEEQDPSCQNFQRMTGSPHAPSISMSHEFQQNLENNYTKADSPHRGWPGSAAGNPDLDRGNNSASFQSEYYAYAGTPADWSPTEPISQLGNQQNTSENEAIGIPIPSPRSGFINFPFVDQSRENSQLLMVPSNPFSVRRASDPSVPNRPPAHQSRRMRQMRAARSSVRLDESSSQGVMSSFQVQPNFLSSGMDMPAPRAQRGRRNGPLDEKGRIDARRKRYEKSTCIHCKYSKVRCDFQDGDQSCRKCAKSHGRKSLPFPCKRADFLEPVEKGSLEWISQYSINHLCKDMVQRQRLDMPTRMDAQKILDGIRNESFFDTIEVSVGSKVLFSLELNKCEIYMMNVQGGPNPCPLFRKFIDDEVHKDLEWRGLGDIDESLRRPEAVIEANEWQSRQLFTLVAYSSDTRNPPRRNLDPEDERDAQLFNVAAVFSRIVCRGLEHEAIKQVQDKFNLHHKQITPKCLQSVGSILLSLRHRFSRWAVVDCGLPQSHRGYEEKEMFTSRLKGLIETLYFQFCYCLCKNFSKNRQQLSLGQLQGQFMGWSSSGQIWEEYPSVESNEAFQKWLEDGKTVVLDL